MPLALYGSWPPPRPLPPLSQLHSSPGGLAPLPPAAPAAEAVRGPARRAASAPAPAARRGPRRASPARAPAAVAEEAAAPRSGGAPRARPLPGRFQPARGQNTRARGGAGGRAGGALAGSAAGARRSPPFAGSFPAAVLTDSGGRPAAVRTRAPRALEKGGADGCARERPIGRRRQRPPGPAGLGPCDGAARTLGPGLAAPPSFLCRRCSRLKPARPHPRPRSSAGGPRWRSRPGSPMCRRHCSPPLPLL